METSEFAVELCKTEEKDNVMENLYVLFQIREAVSRSEVFQEVFLKFCKFHSKNPVLESLFDKVKGLKKSATLSKVTPAWMFSCEICEFFKNIFF